MQLEDSAQHRAVLSVRDGGTVAYVEDILEQVSSYYTKNETSSAAEIETALENVSDSLTAYYTKSETSSAAEISTAA